MAHYSVLKISDTYISDQYDKVKITTDRSYLWTGIGESYKALKATDKAFRVRYAD